MEIMEIIFIIWLILTIFIIAGTPILAILNKAKQGVIILGIWILITSILFIVNLIIPAK
jgi:hypothetical protein